MEHKLAAEAALKDTSSFFGLFGQPPNLMLACEEYDQAAATFKAQKKFQDSADAFLSSAKLHSLLHSPFLAAKAFESAALLLERNLANPTGASETFCKAANELLISGNSVDKAGEMYLKAAVCVEVVDADIAWKRYMEGMALVIEEDRTRFGLDLFTRAFGFCLRSNKFENALETSKRLGLIYLQLNQRTLFKRQVLSTIIINLKLKDEDNAISVYSQGCMQDSSIEASEEEEGQMMRELLQAYASCNQDALDLVFANSKLVPFLDRELVNLIKNGIKVSAVSSNKFASGNANLNSLQDEIEEEGYL